MWRPPRRSVCVQHVTGSATRHTGPLAALPACSQSPHTSTSPPTPTASPLTVHVLRTLRNSLHPHPPLSNQHSTASRLCPGLPAVAPLQPLSVLFGCLCPLPLRTTLVFALENNTFSPLQHCPCNQPYSSLPMAFFLCPASPTLLLNQHPTRTLPLSSTRTPPSYFAVPSPPLEYLDSKPPANPCQPPQCCLPSFRVPSFIRPQPHATCRAEICAHPTLCRIVC